MVESGTKSSSQDLANVVAREGLASDMNGDVMESFGEPDFYTAPWTLPDHVLTGARRVRATQRHPCRLA